MISWIRHASPRLSSHLIGLRVVGRWVAIVSWVIGTWCVASYLLCDRSNDSSSGVSRGTFELLLPPVSTPHTISSSTYPLPHLSARPSSLKLKVPSYAYRTKSAKPTLHSNHPNCRISDSRPVRHHNKHIPPQRTFRLNAVKHRPTKSPRLAMGGGTNPTT